ncbi:MAG: hypothetical protein A2091_13275 [Desulfuromonadales bacterium GWD2_61_12]|nr:MAG: hypothetical protein A2091_13275 [Desulfuromonadales bacterium GWD2_61_12]
MEWFQIALEYLKVLLTVQVITGVIAIVFFKMFREEIKELIKRTAKIKLPGGGELSTPQLKNLKDEKPINDNASPEPQSSDLQVNIQEDDIEALKSLYNAERARAYFWEYCYLNYYLVPTTQQTLAWFSECTAPLSLSLYDTFMTRTAADPKERKAILDALEKHYLISIENNLITVTPKGHEYITWSGISSTPLFSNA